MKREANRGTAKIPFEPQSVELWDKYLEALYNERAFLKYLDEDSKNMIDTKTILFGFILRKYAVEVDVYWLGKCEFSKRILDNIAYNICKAFKRWEMDFLKRNEGVVL